LLGRLRAAGVMIWTCCRASLEGPAPAAAGGGGGGGGWVVVVMQASGVEGTCSTFLLDDVIQVWTAQMQT
jgi:hypothetical protein